VIYPVQGVQKANHTNIYNLKVQNTKKAPPKTKTKLQVDTHTKEWGFPPIMIAVTKSRLF